MDFTVDTKIYPLEAVYNACYEFAQDNYLFMKKGSGEDEITISIKPKNGKTAKPEDVLTGEMGNELLHQTLRVSVSPRNTEIREKIVLQALSAALPKKEEEELDEELKKILRDVDDELVSTGKTWEEDPLKITVPWEEKQAEQKPTEK